MKLSAALSRIRPSPTVEISALAARLQREGRDVIALAAGEPDMDTPAHIRAAGIAAIEAGRTRYAPPAGLPELRAAIARKLAHENAVHVPPEGVIVSSGGKQVIFNAMMATLDPGDEVVIPAPYWTSYPDIVRLTGAEAVIVPAGADRGFRPCPEAIARAIGPKTRWLILNSPGNPTGAVLDPDTLAAIAAVLDAHPGVMVLSDEIYEHIVQPPARARSIAAVAPALADRVLIVNGVSKGHAMTGWRIGYGAGPVALIRAMTVIQGQSTTTAATMCQLAALAALEGPQDFMAAARDRFRARRDRVVAAFRALPGIDCAVPDGAFYVYPRIAGLIGRSSPGGRAIPDDTAFCAALLEEAGVALVPGAAFGLSPHVRLSYAAADAALDRAMARIADFVRAMGAGDG